MRPTAITRRLADLESAARGLQGGASGRQIQGAGLDEICDVLEEGLPRESRDILYEIGEQIEAFHQRPAYELPDGPAQDIHGFVLWLAQVQSGSSSLPLPLPKRLLLAWRNGFAYHPAGNTPVPLWRCADCLLVLPNSDESGTGFGFESCPSCASTRLHRKKLSGPPWDSWDIFTPEDV
jgi:hypothetical protein